MNFAYYMPYVVSDIEEAKKAYAPGGWAFGIIKDLWLSTASSPWRYTPSGWLRL
jgi:hypothetical protein